MKILSGTTQKALMLELGTLNHCIMEILPVLHKELSMRDYKQFKDMFTDSISTLAVGIHGKLGERLIIRNMKDGQIVVTCLRDTGYNPMPFHLHFNVNAGNCVELLCTQEWEDVGPMYPTGLLSGWDPICGTITRQKTTDE